MGKPDLLTARQRGTNQPRVVEVDANGTVYVTAAGGAPVVVGIPDGADVAQGALADAEVAAAGPASVIAILKRIRTIAGYLSDVLGTVFDAAAVSDVANTISSKLRGLVKWAYERMPASLGQKTMAASFPVVIASNQTAVPVSDGGGTLSIDDAGGSITVDDGGGTLSVGCAGTENHIGQVGAEGDTIWQTPTVTVGAYLANDCVGGMLTFASAARNAGGGGVLKDVIILDDAGQDAELELWLFNASFTSPGDNAPWAPSQADLRKLVAIASTADGAWRAAGTPSAIVIEVSQRYDLVGTSMFGQLVTRGTPTFLATDDVSTAVGLLQD